MKAAAGWVGVIAMTAAMIAVQMTRSQGSGGEVDPRGDERGYQHAAEAPSKGSALCQQEDR